MPYRINRHTLLNNNSIRHHVIRCPPFHDDPPSKLENTDTKQTGQALLQRNRTPSKQTRSPTVDK